ncbi:MAG: glycosyltransferase [Planctomycetota bacterium]
MRVLVLANRVSDPMRGDPAIAALVVRSLVDAGHEVHLVCSSDEPLRSHGDLTVHPVHEQRAGVLPSFGPKAAGVAASCNPDAVLAFRPHLPLGWGIASRAGVALVPVIEESSRVGRPLLTGVGSAADRAIVRRSPLCVACGPMAAEDAWACRAGRVVELPGVAGGFAKGEGSPAPSGWLRDRLGLPEESVVAVGWGELSPDDGTDIVIEGLKVAADADADVHAVLAGGERGAIERYASKAQRLGIEHRLHLVGRWPAARLASLAAEADILLQPSVRPRETPRGFWTFLASGRPVLVSEAEGRQRLVGTDDPGSLVAFAPADRLGIGHVLGELSSSSDARDRLGSAAAAHVRVHHVESALAASLVEALDAIPRSVAGVYASAAAGLATAAEHEQDSPDRADASDPAAGA